MNRRFVPTAEAAIPITDRGFTRSGAVYDVVDVTKLLPPADDVDRGVAFGKDPRDARR